jgi:tetratricopeptide (TPR) repeat protein
MAKNGEKPLEATATPQLQKIIEDMRPGAGSTGETEGAAQASLKVYDILAARKDAVTSPAARLQFARWAELSAEKARQILADQDAPMDAKVAASESLPPDEAMKVLLAAVAADPDNPYLHHQLGNLYSADPKTASKAAAEFAAQAQLDPDNALAYYQLAASLFAQGDADGAVDALQSAQNLSGANAYTMDAASYQQDALEQSGVASEVAQLLVALTAGTSQYGDLTGLGNQLMEYGKYYEQNGQTELASQIYNSVRLFGEQLANDSTFANELLAGLDIQREAVTVLSGLVDFVQQPANADMLARSSEHLVGALNAVGGLFTSLNEFFQQELGNDMVNAFVNYVMQNGDLDVLDYLSGSGAKQ